MGWRDLSDDPNARPVLRARHESVRRAARPPLRDRAEHIVELCRDARVLDVGCVDHRTGLHTGPNFLHRRLADVASSCLGVDVEAAGVAAMQRAGFDALVHDVCAGPGPIAARGPFDVVVAGEVVEHLASPQALFEVAGTVLAPGGRLVVTTPNPYAPHRVRAGQLGVSFENADHVVYAFPSGVAELGARAGFELEEYRTVFTRPLRTELRRAAVRLAVAARDRVLGNRREPDDGPDAEIVPALMTYVNPFELAFVAATRSSRFLGETAFYVLRKRAGADSP
jgi:2-polyprenyl-3-methyl-5-hydroxy-6-metoxy-1,4-benzoquinol methylase